jgi:hypothetical protein
MEFVHNITQLSFFMSIHSWCFDRLEFCPKFVRQVNWQSTEFLGSSPPIQFLFPHFWLDFYEINHVNYIKTSSHSFQTKIVEINK